MMEYIRDALDVVAIGCIWLGCLTLHLRIRKWCSLAFLASTSILLLVSTVGVWALQWHNGQPFVDDWRNAIAVVFGDALLDMQFSLLVVSSISFYLVSRSVKRPN